MEIDPSVISFNVILGILLVDVLLSGDNAIVIALVCRSLPKTAQFRVMWLGILGAFVARLLLTMVATTAMELPLIKLIGGVLLLKISVQLIIDNVRSEGSHEPDFVTPQQSVYAAAKTIILADIVMSLDNVLALSAVTGHNFPMLILGLVLSIPILMFGSIYISRLLDRFPILLWGGAAILGGVSGGLLIDDPVFNGMFSGESTISHTVVPLLSAAFVVQVARIMLANRALVQGRPTPPDLWDILWRKNGSSSPAISSEAAAKNVSDDVIPWAPAKVAEEVDAKDATEIGQVLISEVGPNVGEDDLAQAPSVQAETRAEVAAAPVVERSGVPVRDYRIVIGLIVFMALIGWIIYAMVSGESPAAPERFAAYRCNAPVMVVHYRANGAQVKLTSIKGEVQGRVIDGRIAWNDYALAVQTLNLQPPLRLQVSQDNQLMLDGGAFDHTICIAAQAPGSP